MLFQRAQQAAVGDYSVWAPTGVYEAVLTVGLLLRGAAAASRSVRWLFLKMGGFFLLAGIADAYYNYPGLEKRGHHVTVTADGRATVAAFEKCAFDVILMDVQMPEMNGFEAAAEIRHREQSTGGHIPIVAMTAHALNGDEERCLAAGMDAYTPKPIRAAELYSTLEDVVSKHLGAASDSEDRVPLRLPVSS